MFVLVFSLFDFSHLFASSVLTLAALCFEFSHVVPFSFDLLFSSIFVDFSGYSLPFLFFQYLLIFLVIL